MARVVIEEERAERFLNGPLLLSTPAALVKHYHAEAGDCYGGPDHRAAPPGAELFIAPLTLVETLSVFAIKVRTGAFDPPEFDPPAGAFFATHVARQRYQVVRLLNTHYDRVRWIFCTSYGLNTASNPHPRCASNWRSLCTCTRRPPSSTSSCADQRLCSIAALEGLAGSQS